MKYLKFEIFNGIFLALLIGVIIKKLKNWKIYLLFLLNKFI